MKNPKSLPIKQKNSSKLIISQPKKLGENSNKVKIMQERNNTKNRNQ